MFFSFPLIFLVVLWKTWLVNFNSNCLCTWIAGSYLIALIIFFQADFLKELPSHNEDNFTRFHTDSSCRSNVSIVKLPTSKSFSCEGMGEIMMKQIRVWTRALESLVGCSNDWAIWSWYLNQSERHILPPLNNLCPWQRGPGSSPGRN